jgi:hypothetical protein
MTLTGREALTWGYQNDDPGEKCYLHINGVPDSIQFELLADTHYLSPANMEALLRGIEAVTVEAALGPAAAGNQAAGSVTRSRSG